MEHGWKRWLSGLLCLVMVLSMLSVTAWADTVIASGSCGDALTWELTADGTLVVSGSGPMYDYPGFSQTSQIRTIVIEPGVTSIGKQAFNGFSSLTKVTLPEGLTRIGNNAFYACEKLTRVDIPQSVISIGTEAFALCYNLGGIWVDPLNNGYANDRSGVLFDKDMITLIQAPGGIYGSYTVPAGVQYIEDGAFAQCYDLTWVTLPEGLRRIGANAFSECSYLYGIDLPEGLTTIGGYAFSLCYSLQTVDIPKSLTSIGSDAFHNCFSLKGIWVDPENRYYTSDDQGVLFNKSMTTLILAPTTITGHYTVPAETTVIEKSAFSESSGLTSITLPKGLTRVGMFAFTKCSRLKEVTYYGTKEQWAKISFGQYTEYLTRATIHYLGEGATVVSPTCTEPGYTLYVCSECGITCQADPVPVLGHRYSGGSCTLCGEADPDWVADPGLTLRYPTLSFEDEIFYNVYYTVEDMSSVVEMGLMLLPSLMPDGTMDDAIGTVPGYVTNGTSYLVRTEGIPAVNMGDAVYFKVYAKLTDGSYAYSDAGGYNARAYADTVLGGAYPDAMKALVVAMVNYGAEAQTFFGHSTDDLVNSALTDEQMALVSGYDETMLDPVVSADSTKTGSFVRVDSNFRELYPSVSFDGAFSINYYCTPAITIDSGMTLYWWDSNTYGSIDQFTLDNATGSMEMTMTNGQYWGCVAQIAARDMDKTYHVSCVFESEGQTVTTGIISYSLGRYCQSKAAADGDPQQTFAQATAVYGYYAKRYFASIA